MGLGLAEGEASPTPPYHVSLKWNSYFEIHINLQNLLSGVSFWGHHLFFWPPPSRRCWTLKNVEFPVAHFAMVQVLRDDSSSECVLVWEKSSKHKGSHQFCKIVTNHHFCHKCIFLCVQPTNFFTVCNGPGPKAVGHPWKCSCVVKVTKTLWFHYFCNGVSHHMIFANNAFGLPTQVFCILPWPMA